VDFLLLKNLPGAAEDPVSSLSLGMDIEKEKPESLEDDTRSVESLEERVLLEPD
jgi:hypothetical protein